LPLLPTLRQSTTPLGIKLTFRIQVDNARSKFKLDERIPEMKEGAQNRFEDGKQKLDALRDDAKNRINSEIDRVDRTVEQKASEAKGWFGSKK
jgi:hypothetical protein